MSSQNKPLRTVVIVILTTVALTVGVGAFATPALAAQTISNQRDIASHADSTTQQFSFSFDLPSRSISCTLKTSDTLGQYGITLKSASVSGTDKLSLSVNSNGNVDMTLKSGSGSASATVTLTMSTETVTLPGPSATADHKANCGGSGPSSAAMDAIETQASGFKVQETGIKNTSETAIQSDDTTIQNNTTLTQSVDLDLVVPDDGDGDGDIYNVTIDTQEAQANGIRVTGASVENDPSGANSKVAIVNTTVENDENVTVAIREAAGDHNDGNVSRETLTVALDLDSTGAGTFQEDSSIAHVITDEAGNETASVTFSSTVSGSDSGSGSTDGNKGTDVSLKPSSISADKNSTKKIDLVVDNATTGIGTVGITVNTSNTSVLTITAVDYKGASAFFTPTWASDNSSLTLDGAAAEIDGPGETTVATLTVSTHATGNVNLSLSVASLANKSGSQYTVTGTNGANVTVTNRTAPPPLVGGGNGSDGGNASDGQGKNPTDTDGDGKYEDVDGSGDLGFNDLTVFFANLDSETIKNNKDFFDYDGNGKVTINDLTQLFNQIQNK